MKKKQVLILGGGFGGVYTAYYLLKKLKSEEADITLVNNTNYFLFTPMLHEVATGNIRVHNVVEPIREILKGDNFFFCKSDVEEINLNKRKVKTSHCEFEYDYLVVALGSETNFYGMEGSENCLTLKDLQDAYSLRNHIIDMFEHASLHKNKKKIESMLTFTIIGAGPTGVELACEVADWIYKSFSKEYKKIDFEKVRVVLINSRDKVLTGINEGMRDFAAKILKKKKVEVINSAKCMELGPNHIGYHKDDKKIKKINTKTIVWTAGVKSIDVKTIGVEKERGAFPVSGGLKVKGYDNVYALGDNASYVNPKDDSRPPPTAQLAHRQSKGLANNIVANIRGQEEKPFVFVPDGFLASLGKWEAIADMKGIRFHGFFAWWLWRTIYLTKLIGIENKLRVMLDWTFDLFFTRDTSQV